MPAELTSAHVAFGVLGLAAAMFGLAWLLDRRPADGAFAIQALITGIAVPGYASGWYEPLGRWAIPASVLATSAAAFAAVEFTRLHLDRPPPWIVRGIAALAAIVMLAAALPAPRVTIFAGIGFSWACIVYAIVAHVPLLRDPARARAAVVLLAAWTIIMVGSDV